MLLFDIGSNVGDWALKNYTNNQIICVEASPTTFKTLVANTSNKNIICLNYAVTSSKEEEIEFFDCDTNTISTLNQKWLNDPSSRFFNQFRFRKIKVNTITLDKLIETYGIPDLLKIDVEGAEDIVLQSLNSPVKIICFEWAAEMQDVIINSINHLDSLGYQKFHIQNQDKYDYRPPSFELNKTELLNIIKIKIFKVDWGMIWCYI